MIPTKQPQLLEAQVLPPSDGKTYIFVPVMTPPVTAPEPRMTARNAVTNRLLAIITVTILVWSIVAAIVLADTYPTQVGWGITGAIILGFAVLFIRFFAVMGAGMAGSVMEMAEDMRSRRR